MWYGGVNEEGSFIASFFSMIRFTAQQGHKCPPPKGSSPLSSYYHSRFHFCNYSQVIGIDEFVNMEHMDAGRGDQMVDVVMYLQLLNKSDHMHYLSIWTGKNLYVLPSSPPHVLHTGCDTQYG